MTPTEALTPLQALAAVDDALDRMRELGELNPADWDEDAVAILVWDKLDQLATSARILAYQHAAVLGKRMPSELTHPDIGPVHVETEKVERWNGDAILTVLSDEAIFPATGEICQAIPTDALRKIIPAVKPGATSSKWNKTGLLAAGIQPASYSETEWGGKVLKRGPKYQRKLTAGREGRVPPPDHPTAP